MSTSVNPDAPRTPAQSGFGERLAFAFGSDDGTTCGVAELGVLTGGRGERLLRAHALLFVERRLVSSAASPPFPGEANAWEDIGAAGVRTAGLAAPGRWSLAYGDESGHSFELEFAALGDPVSLDATTAFAQSTGVEGYEQLCRVTGSVTVSGDPRSVEGLGQRGRSWGRSDWGGAQLTRRLGAWLEGDTGLVAWAARPRRSSAHDAEAVTAFLVEAPAPVGRVDEARLSTTYDRDGHPLRAGLELWPSADAEYPRRLAGETVCRASLDLQAERLECAFLEWHMEGRAGIGCYELRRRA